MIIDLDPGEGGVADAKFAAVLARDLLTEAGLVPYLMATGSRGYHVVVPIRPLEPFEEVRAVAFGLAEAMVRRAPDRLTTEFQRKSRGPAVPRLQPERLCPDGRARLRGAPKARRARRCAARLGRARGLSARRVDCADNRGSTRAQTLNPLPLSRERVRINPAVGGAGRGKESGHRTDRGKNHAVDYDDSRRWRRAMPPPPRPRPRRR